MDKSSRSSDENPVSDVEACTPSTSKSGRHSEDGRLTAYPIHDLNGEAVFLAPPGSENLVITFGNTTEWHLALSFREVALKDAQRALSLDCDPKLRARLEEREAAILKLPRYPITEGIPPHLINPMIPCASNAVALARSEIWGWHLVAARDVLPGEILVYERPYVIQVRRSQRKLRCHECCAFARDAIPCLGCNRVVFCDEQCRNRSLQRGHRFECPLMEVLIERNVSSAELCALRTALRARCETSSWSQLRSMVESWDERARDLFVYEPDSYAAFYNLRNYNQEKRTMEDVKKMGILSTALIFSLAERTSFFADIDDDKDFWFFGGLLFHHIMVCVANAYGIRVLVPDIEGHRSKAKLIGSNVSLLLSRIYHSSKPNVVQVMQNGMTALIAVRPLEEGQQLFNGFRCHYNTKEKC